jgi:lambda repressor-like predicted transcriptional regulator
MQRVAKILTILLKKGSSLTALSKLSARALDDSVLTSNPRFDS